jgi:8-oxo-dGTP diphosphatase
MPKPVDKEKQKYMFTDDIKFLQKAVVFHPENEDLFLALKRSSISHSRPNEWDLPGGNVLFGELHENSLRKEISEEANLEIEKICPMQVVTNYDKTKEIYYIFIGYRCKAKTDQIKISEEHSEYKWVDKKEFISLRPAQFLIDLAEEYYNINS